tara:strand:+ start:245 stop:562 length:318 start_codon:yes stop_codon:yes gene_type:complete
MDRLALIKKIAEEKQAKINEEAEFQASIVRLDARKAAKKEADKLALKEHKRLTQQVKKAGKAAPNNFDMFKPENMYYSDKEVSSYLEGSSYMDAYNANKSADGDY